MDRKLYLYNKLSQSPCRCQRSSDAKPLWTNCKIVEIHQTKSVGKYLGHGLSMESGDVEVVAEVKMIDPAKGNPLTNFWYALRNIKGEWKITSTAHIPDANYPRLD